MNRRLFGRTLALMTCAGILLCAASAAAQNLFPGLRLRGTLSDIQGVLREGLTVVTARIYPTATGGTPLYAEQFTAMLTAGNIDLILGIGTGTPTGSLVDALLPDGNGSVERYLALQVEPDTEELQPLRRITASPFAGVAISAVDARALGGQPPSSYATVAGVTAQLAGYATLAQLGNVDATSLGGQPASSYATTTAVTTQLSSYTTTQALTQQLASYATTQALESYVTTQQASIYATTQQLSNYATTQELANYVQANSVTQQNITAPVTYQPTSTVTFAAPAGTAPFAVSSTAVVSNLNCDTLDSLDSGEFARLGVANLFTGDQLFEAEARFEGPVTFAGSAGSPPFAVTSSVVVPNLNASLLGGLASSAFARLGTTNTFSTAQNFGAGTTFAGQATFSSTAGFAGSSTFSGPVTFSVAPTFPGGGTFTGAATFSAPPTFAATTGTAPFDVASTTEVANLNAALLNGKSAAQIVSEAGGGACTSCNDALALGGQLPAFYTNASNLASGTVPNAALPANLCRTSGTATSFLDGFLALRAPASAITTTLHAAATVTARDVTFPDASGTVVTTGNLAAITALPGLITPITPAQGGLGISTSGVIAGDILYALSAGQWAVLPKGTNGQVLKLNSGLPSWDTDNTGSAGTLPITSGGTGAITAATARTNLGVAASGVNSDITSLTGLVTPLSNAQGGLGINTSAVQTGDVLYATGAAQWGILAKSTGVDGQVLKLQGGVPAWGTDSGGGGGGTITSITTGAGLTVTGSVNPITSSGTISVDGTIPRLGAANPFTAAQSVTSPAAGTVPLTLTGAPGQAANLQEWKSSGGASVASMGAAGVITAAGFSGNGASLTALDASQLSSGIVPAARLSGSVATTNTAQSFSATKTFLDTFLALRNAGDNASTTLRSLAGANNTITFPDVGNAAVITDLNLGAINATGTIGSGVWQGTAIATAYGGLGQSTSAAVQGSVLYKNVSGIWQALIPGTAGQVLKTGGPAANPSWQNDLAGTGTVTSLTQGTGISLSPATITTTGSISINTATVPLLAASNTFTGGQVLAPSAPAGIPLTVQGAALQSADLQRWVDGDGNTAAWVTANGNVEAMSFAGAGSGLTALNATQLTSGTLPDARLSSNVATTNTAQTMTGAKTFNDNMLVLKASGGSLTTLRTNAGVNNVISLPAVATGTVVTTSNLTDVTSLPSLQSLAVTSAAAGTTPVTITGAVSQTASLLDVKASGGSALMSVNPPSGLGGAVGVGIQGYNAAQTPLAITAASSQTANLFDVKAFGGSPLVSVNAPSAAPGASGLTIQGYNAAQIPLLVKGASAQSAKILDVQSNLGASYMSVTSMGQVSVGNLSATTLSASGGSLSGLSGLALSSGSLSMPAGTTLSLAGNATLSGATLSGTASLSGATLSSGTFASPSVSGTLTASGTLGLSGNFNHTGGTFSGTFTGDGTALSGGGRQEFLGAPRDGCELRGSGASAQIYCPDATSTMRKCFHANEIATQPTCAMAATPAACNPYCVNSGASSASIPSPIPMGKFLFKKNGTHEFDLTRGVACFRYNNMATRTVTTRIYFCDQTPNDCTDRPVELDNLLSSVNASTTSTFSFVDGPLASGVRTFTLSTAPAPLAETQVQYRLNLVANGTPGINATVCFVVGKNTASASVDPQMNVKYYPNDAIPTW